MINAPFVRARSSAKLSPRERQIWTLRQRGLLIKQIAYDLGIAESTVKLHLTRIRWALERAQWSQA